MSTPLRERKTCQPRTRNRLIKWFRQCKSIGYVDDRAKRVAMYIENRLQQGGEDDPSLFRAIDSMKRGTAGTRPGKETAEDFDRLTGGRYA